MTHRILWALLLVGACAPDPRLTKDELALLRGLTLDGEAPPVDPTSDFPDCGEGTEVPADWEVIDEHAAAGLGEDLYGDTGFSGPLALDNPFTHVKAGTSGTINCNSCHDLERGGADPWGAATSFGGEGFSKNNSPTVFNTKFRPFFSWNETCSTMWGQIRRPLLLGFHGLRRATCAVPAGDAMDASPCVSKRVRAAYGLRYKEVFGENPEAATDEVIVNNVAKALEAYLRTLETGPTPFDDFVRGFEDTDTDDTDTDDTDVLSASALRGARLFVGRAACDTCHWGPMLSDGRVHDLGLPKPEGDEGKRYQTPPLRGIAETAPYMHDGGLKTLDEVVWFYNDGGGDLPSRDLEVVPLGLDDAEMRDLVAFLESLTGPLVDGGLEDCAP